MIDAQDLELLRLAADGPREFRPTDKTDEQSVAFDPIGDRLLALCEAGLLRLVGDPLMNHETVRGATGGLLSAIGMTVQTLGAAPTAWQLVQAAAAALGLHLH